jgi:MFS family permease
VALFARHLDASEFQFGLLTALPFIASLISMPASVLIERTGRRKLIFLVSLYLQRLLWFAIALVPVWMVRRNGGDPHAAMFLFLLLTFLMHAGGAVGGPAWVSWMADVVPQRSRGKYFARRRQWGCLSAVPAAFLVGYLLDRIDQTHQMTTLIWCALIFCGAAIFGLADIAMFQPVREPYREPAPRAPVLKLLSQPLRDRQFLLLAGFVGTMTFAVSFMGQFVTLYMIERLKIGASQTQAMLLIAPLVAQLLVFGFWGKVVDRMGKRPALALAGLGLVPVGLGWCFVSPHNPWLGYVLSAAGAALWAGVEVANLNIMLQFSTSDEAHPHRKGGSNYVAMNSVIINVAGCLGGLASGVIAQSLRGWEWHHQLPLLQSFTFYEVLFILSGVLRLMAVVAFLPLIHEPTARRTRETFVYISANIYNNLISAALQPLRFARIVKAATYVDRDEN